jgi:outer membrane protein insertion porin family
MTLTRSLTLGVSVLALTHLGLMATGASAQEATPAPVQDAPATAPAPPADATTVAPAATEAAPAAAPAAAEQTAYVDHIVISGNERIDSQTIISYLPFQPGVTVDAQLIDAAVKTLYRTDLFSDVQIAMNGNEMVVTVVESPIINQVVFEGNHAMTKDKLRDEVQIRPRGVFTKAKVQEDVQRIIELYR